MRKEGPPLRDGPVTTLSDLEGITSAWVQWYNTSRLMHRLGRRSPAEVEVEVEVEVEYYDQQTNDQVMVHT